MTPGRLGVAAAAFAAACALMLAIVAAANRSPGAPQEVPYAPVLGLMLAAPAGIGVLGAMSGRRVLLVAAGVACLAQSAIAFSGVTLVFLVPALLFLRAGIAGDGGRPEPVRPERVRAVRLIVLVLAAVPVALIVVLTLGVLGVLLLVAVGAVLPALARRGGSAGPRLRFPDAVLGVGLVALVIAGWVALFSNSVTTCWQARQTPTGLVYERIPQNAAGGPVGGSSGIVAPGCDGGQLTIEGAGLAGVLVIGALGLSGLAAVRAP